MRFNRSAILIASPALLALLLAACGPLSGLVAEPTLENAGTVQIIAAGSSPVEGDHLQVQPGGELELTLARLECCVFWEQVDANPAWTVTPAVGAAIDPTTGLLTIDAEIASGVTYTVTATLGAGRQVFEAEVTVYSPTVNPLVGLWREVAQLSCDNGEEVPALNPIGELIFAADGSLSVTWQPFEAYVDYAGTYTAEEGALSVQPREVNYLPAVLDETGNYRIDEQGRLRLENLWLGAPPQNPAAATQCGHIFSPR